MTTNVSNTRGRPTPEPLGRAALRSGRTTIVKSTSHTQKLTTPRKNPKMYIMPSKAPSAEELRLTAVRGLGLAMASTSARKYL